jgi:uncharacterized phage protein (TIGR02220 family)
MRIRTIKPEFFLHEGLYLAEYEEKLPMRLAFVGLWCAADREGRFRWEPRKLGVQIFPYDKVDFSRVLDALATRGFICRYASATCECGMIPSFLRHQIINNRERASDLPNPLDCNEYDASSTRDARDTETHKGKGREGNKEGKGTRNMERRVAARRVLLFLNERTGRSFREADGNLDIIARRLSEDGVDEEGMIQMIDRQARYWGASHMVEFLRPSTLFGTKNFGAYYASRLAPVPPTDSPGKPAEKKETVPQLVAQLDRNRAPRMEVVPESERPDLSEFAAMKESLTIIPE